jgi:hypothetical protein
MRRRINRTLLTATAASASLIGLSFMAAGGAGATSNPPIVTNATCATTTVASPANDCAMAGYEASNRLFRYAQASIVVPSHAGMLNGVVGTTEPDPQIYVALDDTASAFDYVRVGIRPVCTTAGTGGACATPDTVSGWQVFSTVAEPNGPTGITGTSVLLPVSAEGHGIFVSAYLTPSGNSVHTVIKTPATTAVGTGGATTTTPGATYNNTLPVSGPTYSDAQAVADWNAIGADTATQPWQPTALLAPTTALTQFFLGRFTTWNGTRGTFTGKWITTEIEATLDGTSATATVASPGYLWSNDSFPSDAFGVWLRHV